MKRRLFLSTTGAAFAGSALAAKTVVRNSPADPPFPLVLPPLPYEPAALEPHIDAQTMSIHHDKHHAAYVTKLNEALKAAKVEATDALVVLKGLSMLPPEVQTAVRNNGGGHVNHSLFWKWMAPPSGEKHTVSDKLGAAIQAAFSGMDDFKKAFSEAAAKRFGSGWAWLIAKSDGKVAVTSTPNQDNPWMKGIVPDTEVGTPILGLDVWEHAYYLKYQNRRPDYIAAWWSVVNWPQVNALYKAAVPA
jgi:Fe-Mn family superoxide dismutase